MEKFYLLVIVLMSCAPIPQQMANNPITTTQTTAKQAFMGSFADDYNIKYSINDSVWKQLPNTTYHIIVWDTAAQYILARNGAKNLSDAGLYTRIDYMQFVDMAPFNWGFCLTTYNAQTEQEAKKHAEADRKNPKNGCNGFPFSRMKRLHAN